jgi:hypothetical protein
VVERRLVSKEILSVQLPLTMALSTTFLLIKGEKADGKSKTRRIPASVPTFQSRREERPRTSFKVMFEGDWVESRMGEEQRYQEKVKSDDFSTCSFSFQTSAMDGLERFGERDSTVNDVPESWSSDDEERQ